MANKTLKKKVQAKPAISKLTTPVAESVRDAWFAGLGVFSVAQQESSKLIDQGNRIFDKLVSEGTKLEKKALHDAESVAGEFKDGIESRLDIARRQVAENWGGVENAFDERVLGTLDRLGIPTTKELSRLSGRVQKMSRQAVNNWKEWEAIFEGRVAEALKNLQVPKAEDIRDLSASVEGISSDTVASLNKLEKDLEGYVSAAVKRLQASAAEETRKLNAGVKVVSDQVAQNRDKLEAVVEARVAEALGRAGIPSAEQLDGLSAELKTLSGQVAALEKKLAAGNKPVARKSTAKKSAVSDKTAPTK